MTELKPGVTDLMDAIPRSGPLDNPCAACAVRDMSVCGALKGNEIGRLNAIAVRTNVGAGETLFLEGDAADHIYVVIDGCIKIYKMLPDGRRQITGFLYQSDMVGLAFRQRYAFSADAVSNTLLCRFPREGLEKLLDEFPEMERRLLSISSNELASAQDQMLLLGQKTAAEKVATFLWLLSRRAELKGADPHKILLPMMRSDIGDYLGLTIETVSRTMTQFRKRGLISFTSSSLFQIEDPAGLAEVGSVDESWEASVALIG